MKTRQRWITIGEVERRFVVVGNSGFPFGLAMRWRGRVDWCQPCEFVRDKDLWVAVQTRLRLAGLLLVSWQGDLPRLNGERLPLVVLVRRLPADGADARG